METENKTETTVGNSADEDISVISEEFVDVGIEVLDLTEKDREALTSLVDQSALPDTETRNRPGTTVCNFADKDIPVISREFIAKVEYLYKWHKTMGYYKMIGIKEYATDEQIRNAFFAKTHELHPDKFPSASDDLKQKLNELISYLNAARSTSAGPSKEEGI